MEKAMSEAITAGISAAVESHAKIDHLERAMREWLPPVEIEPVHYFADGTYAREITIPAGTLLTGKIHKTEHLNVISKGMIAVWSPNEEVRYIRAPFTFVAKPGTRRVGLAYEDTVWTTIHATGGETDLGALEALLIEPHDSSIELPENIARHLLGVGVVQ
jgi:hypothetical protein